MPSTPPPPARLRTPPTPLHGPKYDSYEPYSPRRSSRINSKKEYHSFTENMEPKSQPDVPRTSPHSAIKRSHNSRFTPAKKPTIKRTSSQTFSPPSSPMSPGQQISASLSRQSPRRPETSRRYPQITDNESDADMYAQANNSTDRRYGEHGIPTPTKTPRKRAFQTEQQLSSTARILFPNRPANIDDIVPSPRKARRHRHAVFAADSFADERVEEAIPIFTDSRERVPDDDIANDNPFMSRAGPHGTRQTAHVSIEQPLRHGMTKEIDEAVNRGEGLVYVFRGKKFYRQFTEQDSEAGEDDVDLISDGGPQREARDVAIRPQRKTIKPRRLFAPEKPSRTLENVDEEALTDIEADPMSRHISKDRASTPSKQFLRASTPPTTVKKTRASLIPEDQAKSDHVMSLGSPDDELSSSCAQGRKKTNLFDGWPRTKPGVGKRSRDVEKVEGSVTSGSKGKRSKSAHHAVE